MSAIIRVQNACLGYGKRDVIRGVDCEVGAGQSVGLVGPNGSGKTTFLRAILGQLKPRTGSIWRDKGLRFAYVPQAEEIGSYWPLTIRELVELPARSLALFGRSVSGVKKARESLQRVGLSPLAGRLLSEVSGGQRQRAVLAQALAQEPDVLLLDEPTRGLDITAESGLLDLIRDLRRQKKLTVLLVTHTLQIPLNFSESILLFSEGRVVSATPKELTKTKILEKTYGVPFVYGEQDGFRWVSPARSAP